ncbi:YpjP family protein [Paenibacillus lactis]|uniref:YpjP family protein n=1 Tax=Paenibacillus lactis TaxID=228574 RepID=UPI001FC9E8F0|nr:YpjP family protein [Paenibacillus lactis]
MVYLSFWRSIKKIASVLVLVMLLNTAFAAITVSALPTHNELQQIQDELNLTESEIQELLLFIQENSTSIEEAIEADDNLRAKIDQYNEYSRKFAMILAFADIASSQTSTISHLSDSNIQSEISPAVWPIVWAVVSAIIKAAVKKKMGKKIVQQIGRQFDEVVWPKIEPGIKREYEINGYSRNVGPESATEANGIRQGEHIISLYGQNGKEYLRLDVYTSQSRNHTRWHYHTKDDWKDHKGNVDLYHNSLPKWGSE